MLTSTYNHLGARLNCDKVIELILSQELSTYNGYPYLLGACMRFIGIYVEYTSEIDNSHNLLTLIFGLLGCVQPDEVLLQLCSTLLILSRHLPDNVLPKVVNTWIDVLPRFVDHAYRVECIDHADNLSK